MRNPRVDKLWVEKFDARGCKIAEPDGYDRVLKEPAKLLTPA